MGLGFLAPLFLGGLALVVVPLLVHLTRRDKATPTPFPSLMFVRRLPQPTTRRRKLRDLPLLLLRVLALVLLAAAFARPLLDSARRRALPGAGGRELVVLLDRSYSMGTPGRWARAQDAARRALATLGPNDRASVILFNGSPAVAAERVSGAAARSAVDTAHVTAGPTRYAPALARAAQILGASPLPRREVLLVSDFQRSGWRPTAASHLPAGARLTWADVGGAAPADVAVAGVELRREAATTRVGNDSAGERVRPVARIVLPNGGAARTVPVTLAVNGRTVQTLSTRVVPGAAASVTFDPVPVPPGWSSGVVRVPNDSLPADDAGACCCGRRRSTTTGPTCRSTRCTCRSSGSSRRTPRASSPRRRRTPWGRRSTRRRSSTAPRRHGSSSRRADAGSTFPPRCARSRGRLPSRR